MVALSSGTLSTRVQTLVSHFLENYYIINLQRQWLLGQWQHLGPTLLQNRVSIAKGHVMQWKFVQWDATYQDSNYGVALSWNFSRKLGTQTHARSVELRIALEAREPPNLFFVSVWTRTHVCIWCECGGYGLCGCKVYPIKKRIEYQFSEINNTTAENVFTTYYHRINLQGW